jgi:hypothetical protein
MCATRLHIHIATLGLLRRLRFRTLQVCQKSAQGEALVRERRPPWREPYKGEPEGRPGNPLNPATAWKSRVVWCLAPWVKPIAAPGIELLFTMAEDPAWTLTRLHPGRQHR